MKRVLLLDTETTGLEVVQGATCIEVAVMLFDVKRGSPIASFASLIQGDSNAAQKINGIDPELLKTAYSADIVWRAVKWLATDAEAVIAHRWSFDQQFCPPLGLPGICSKVDLQYPDGRRGDSLVQLALNLGLGVASAHRASADVETMGRIFSRLHEMGNDLEAMFLHALRPKLRCVALASFEQKELVKSHGFLWDPKMKHWWRDVPIDEVDSFPFPIRKGTMPGGGEQ